MKALLLSLIIALAAQQCQEENDDPNDGERTIDEQGYVAEDIIRREALEKWEHFLFDSHKKLLQQQTASGNEGPKTDCFLK
jgi:hypothetical protein